MFHQTTSLVLLFLLCPRDDVLYTSNPHQQPTLADAASTTQGGHGRRGLYSGVTLDDVVEPQVLKPFLLAPNPNRRRRRSAARQLSRSLVYSLPVNSAKPWLLNVSLFDSAVAPRLLVQHFDAENHTYARTVRRSRRRCIYRGSIVGDEGSDAVVNVCHGMFGGIKTGDGNAYFIEPLTTAFGSQPSQHLLYQYNSSQPFHDTFQNSYTDRTHPQQPNDTSHGHVIRLRRDVDSRLLGQWSREHHVELMVVADAYMRHYHGAHLEAYVLTLISIVATIYRHPSLDAAINIVVVRIILLESTNSGLTVTDSAQQTLQNFCRWQHTLNEAKDTSLNHHDAAILLTRKNICRAIGKCDTLGLAELGTMCDSHRSCAIIEDNGLSAAFTIAHELGHLFNIPHDDEKRCGKHMELRKENYHIMAPTLEHNTHPWSWSVCSAHSLKRFLEVGRKTYCIQDRPGQMTYSAQISEQEAPGQMFGVNQQCQFVFGSSAKVCPYMPVCKRLWCSTTQGNQVGCRTQHMPWADGTPCGLGRWCHGGHCVGLAPEHLQPVDGGWSSWGEWSSCSRTCGGGVRTAIRNCENPRPRNGGKFCTGLLIKYSSCNMMECDLTLPDFRQTQCQKLNGQTMRIHNLPKDVKWKAKTSRIVPNERCRLWCEVDGQPNLYFKLKDRVIDGTACDITSDDICVNGHCLKAGCDHRLGSSLARDQCGVCGGDGESCQEERGRLDESLTHGYNLVMRIPAGATNIDIRQKSRDDKLEDDNYLALKNSVGEFILNGDFQVNSADQAIEVKGGILHYSGAGASIERINSSKTILEDLYLHVLSIGRMKSPDISFSYTISRNPTAGHTTLARYIWRHVLPWSTCDRTCHGSQIQTSSCVDRHNDEPVPVQMCNGQHPVPKKQRICNTHCRAEWATVDAESCSARCGRGTKRQHIFCEKIPENGKKSRIDNKDCDASKKPSDAVSCFVPCNGFHWEYTRWTVCSMPCDGGYQTRSHTCVDRNSIPANSAHCNDVPIESTNRTCNIHACPQWKYGQWSECSHSCGGGVQLRAGVCQDLHGRELDSRMCREDKQDRRQCNTHICTQWRYGEWGSCSKSCGDGIAYREAKCTDNHGRPLSTKQCDASTKINSKPCKITECPSWKTGQWTPCSATCGNNGWKHRTVRCVDPNDRDLADHYCLNATSTTHAPQTHEQCNRRSCPLWRADEWSACSQSCGNGGHMTRNVVCVTDSIVVDDAFCSAHNRPTHTQRCELADCTKWEVGAWQQCSASCDSGIQRRLVFCRRSNDHSRADDAHCGHHTKPQDSRPCTLSACTSTTTTRQPRPFARITWHVGDWDKCSVDCGRGRQSRRIYCKDYDGRRLDDRYCVQLARPSSHRHCETECPAQWVSGDWQECPATCGRGLLQYRRVSCRAKNLNVDESKCSRQERPRNRQPCRDVQPCVGSNQLATWFTGAWSVCSASCGHTGWRIRYIHCQQHGHAVSRRECRRRGLQQPASVQRCIPSHCASPVPMTAWHVGLWSNCSATCGGGVQGRVVECRGPTGGQAPESACSAVDQPRKQRPCNARSCMFWRHGPWSECSPRCGSESKHIRNVFCVDTRGIHRPASSCDPREKPPDSERCTDVPSCAKWSTDQWSECSATCGDGRKRRTIKCVDRGRERPSAECAGYERPSESIQCKVRDCPTYSWVGSAWTPCSVACGIGSQYREIHCMNSYGQRSPDSRCEPHSPAPADRKQCTGSDCAYDWHASSWSSCSHTCGPSGMQYRSMQCRLKTSNRVLLVGAAVPSSFCSVLPEPVSSRPCEPNLPPCGSPYTWTTSDWSQCSTTCGPGIQRRNVLCMDNTRSAASKSFCSFLPEPAPERRCFDANCVASDCRELQTRDNVTVDGMYDIFVRGVVTKLYCANMRDELPKMYIPVAEDENYAEVYSKRLLYPFTCPHGGDRNDSCQCASDGEARAGMTVFSMLRFEIDAYDLKIRVDDLTFARTLHGQPVPFATAGDCYSAVDCPQGRFRISLHGSRFRVSDKTHWSVIGHRTSHSIKRSHDGQVVVGRCGGYCGRCYPSYKQGLLLELAKSSYSPKKHNQDTDILF